MARIRPWSMLAGLFALLLLSGCVVGDPFGATTDRPAIPVPDRYEDGVPDKSDELVVAEALAYFFTPEVTTAYNADGSTAATGPTRVSLFADGAPVEEPVTGNPDYRALTDADRPIIQFIRYWRRLGDVESYAGGSDTTIERTVTRGTSQTNTQTFTESVSVEAEASAGGLFASASVTVSSSFTATQSFSSTTSTEASETRTFSVHPEAGSNMTYSVWQLVEEFRFVNADGTPYDVQAYDFTPESLSFVYPTDEIVPASAYYEN